MSPSSAERPVFVFGPGAWHTPDCFQVVQDKLGAQGYETRAVAYPSVGAEPPTKGLFDDAAAVRAEIQTLADQGRQVILVVHSYGGLVGAEAVKGLGYAQRKAAGGAGGVTLLVYLAAFVTPKGMSILKMLGGQPLPWMNFQVSLPPPPSPSIPPPSSSPVILPHHPPFPSLPLPCHAMPCHSMPQHMLCDIARMPRKRSVSRGRNLGRRPVINTTNSPTPQTHQLNSKKKQGERVIAETPEDIFYHDVPADATKAAIAKLQHQSAAVFRDEVTYQPWEDMECMYFFCDDDRALLPAIQRQLAPMLGADAISYTCKGSHSPFLSEPDSVVEGLLHGATEVQKRI